MIGIGMQYRGVYILNLYVCINPWVNVTNLFTFL